MSRPLDETNLKYGWLAKTRLEEQARIQKRFEEDKAKKEEYKRDHPPWPGKTWQAAEAAFLAGDFGPEPRFPIIITKSTGPFTTPQKLQEVAGLSSLPEVKWTSMSSFLKSEVEAKRQEKVQYCHVDWDELRRVEKYSNGERVLVWFENEKRFAWLAHSVKQKSANQGDGIDGQQSEDVRA